MTYYIDSKHSYERLNWNEMRYAPIVRTCDSVKYSCDCISIPESLTIGKLNSRSSLPDSRYVYVPKYIQQYHKDMLKWMYYQEKLNYKLIFISLTIKPNMIMIKHKKKHEYGTLKYVDQISFLRNKVSLYLHNCNIQDYIIVYEQTTGGLLHAHIVHRVIDPIMCENYKDLAYIVGYTKHKDYLRNVVEEFVHDKVCLCDYLCKIILSDINDDDER